VLDEMKILPFDQVKHIKHLYDWFKLRGMNLTLIDEIPMIGFIAFYKDLGIAAAFLRSVEPNYALLDGLITNPEALPYLRNEAIEGCVKVIIKKAKDLKLKQIMATSIDQGVLDRSKSHGFIKIPDTMIVLAL
jgi:hypothetical protein